MKETLYIGNKYSFIIKERKDYNIKDINFKNLVEAYEEVQKWQERLFTPEGLLIIKGLK